MKTHLIIDTKSFIDVAGYVAQVRDRDASQDWNSLNGKTWRGLAEFLGVDYEAEAKGKARPAIDKVAARLNGKTPAPVPVPAAPQPVAPAPVKPKKEVKVKPEVLAPGAAVLDGWVCIGFETLSTVPMGTVIRWKLNHEEFIYESGFAGMETRNFGATVGNKEVLMTQGKHASSEKIYTERARIDSVWMERAAWDKLVAVTPEPVAPAVPAVPETPSTPADEWVDVNAQELMNTPLGTAVRWMLNADGHEHKYGFVRGFETRNGAPGFLTGKDEKTTLFTRFSMVYGIQVNEGAPKPVEPSKPEPEVSPKPAEKTAPAPPVPAKPEAERSPVVMPPAAPVTPEPNSVEETARLIAQALAGLKVSGAAPEVAPVNLEAINERLAKFEEHLADKYASAFGDVLLKFEQTLNAQIQAAKEAVNAELEARLEEKVAAALAGNVKTVQVQVNGGEPVKVAGLVHEQFEYLVKHAAVRDHVMLVGPAGSGKTTCAEQVAEALKLNFYCLSVCAQTSKSELLGYMDAQGRYVRTVFREAYEHGGVFVLDEIDNGNPNVVSVLNAALANSVCSFADGMVKKHQDFVLIACANTYGQGADRQYVGRNQLDAATLDRFSVLDFGYDQGMENTLAADTQWCQFVQAVRSELKQERVVVSPRATLKGVRLLGTGLSREHVLKAVVLKGMPKNLEERVRAVFNKHYAGKK